MWLELGRIGISSFEYTFIDPLDPKGEVFERLFTFYGNRCDTFIYMFIFLDLYSNF